jgi:LuxR family maltose regulon positive regulatory protein
MEKSHPYKEYSLLASKIQPPLLKPDIIARHYLIARLDKLWEPQVNVALVLAPPGFGKTFLVGGWVRLQEEKTAWVTIEETENNPVSFFQYFSAALASILPRNENSFVFAGTTPSEKELHGNLVALLNHIARLHQKLIIVLDDLHHITNSFVQQELSFLIEHLPENLKVIVTSQHEPDWPLLKMKAAGSLIEIRTTDLAFSYTEAIELLGKMNVRSFSETEVQDLVNRSEGWAFGLQLAAIAASEGNGSQEQEPHDQYVSEYLFQEVFSTLPSELQSFLLEISILETLHAELCAYITGRNNAQQLLASLERRNLFLLPIGDHKEWYRFHYLFLELLRGRNNQLPESEKLALHVQASEWYEKNGFITAAVDHALRSESYDRAVALVEKNLFQLLDQSELLKQSELVSQLPGTILHSRPELLIANAWLLAYSGDCSQAEKYLQDAQESLERATNKTGQRALVGKILTVKSYIHWLRGEDAKIIKTAAQALINLPTDDRMNRSITLISLGEALENNAQLAEALEVYSEAIESSCHENCTHIYIMACAAKIRLMFFLGQMHQANQLATSTIKKVLENPANLADRYCALGNIYAHQAEIHRSWNDLDNAIQLALEGVRLGKDWGQADTTITTRAVQVAVLWSMCEKKEAIAIIKDLRRQAALVSDWYLSYLDAYLILLGVEPEHVKSSSLWLDLNAQVPESDFNFHNLVMCRARVRILCANSRYSEALTWLGLVRREVEKAGNPFLLADTQVMLAICQYGLGDPESAKVNLTSALNWIMAEQTYSIILDKGKSAVELIENYTFDHPLHELTEALLEMAREREEKDRILNQGEVQQKKTSGLSARESEILAYLATHKSSTEIAKDLMVSSNTVRFHVKSIYNKLDVHSRDEAVDSARKQGLIP